MMKTVRKIMWLAALLLIAGGVFLWQQLDGTGLVNSPNHITVQLFRDSTQSSINNAEIKVTSRNNAGEDLEWFGRTDSQGRLAVPQNSISSSSTVYFKVTNGLGIAELYREGQQLRPDYWTLTLHDMIEE